MKIAVFGATGGIGSELIKQALERAYSVTALVRNSARLANKGNGVTVIAGSIHDADCVERCIREQDAVICALGAKDLKKTMIRTEGTVNMISAMKNNNVRRLIVVSAMGVGDSWNSLSLINKLFFAILLKSAREDHEAQETAVKTSGLDWTIVRPSGLVDMPRTGVYSVGENIRAKTSQIPRADVADLILKELEQNSQIGKAITITN